MRVIAGTHKGRIIKAVPGKETRPTGDKIKEAVFHKMGPFFQSGNGLDLFAGSGSLGIEALSRGFKKVIFIDQSKHAIRTIKQNITELKLDHLCELYRNDAFRALEILQRKEATFDLLLIDPPYEKVDYQLLFEKIEETDLVRPNGMIYVEQGVDQQAKLTSLTYELIFERNYNKTTKTMIYKKQSC